MAGFDYRKVGPSLWTGATGRWLRKQSPTVAVVAVYLLTCPSSTQWGLFYLPGVLIANDTGVSLPKVMEALGALQSHGFCRYDTESETVWVVNMCRDQVGDIRGGDKRAKPAIEAARGLLSMPFGPEWYRYYEASLQLPECPIDAPSMPHPEEPEAPSMPGAGSGEKQEQEQEQEQEQNLVLARGPSQDAALVATYLLDAIRSHKPDATDGSAKWAVAIDKAIRIDGRTPEQLCDVIDFAHRSSELFWRPNLLSGEKLRQHYERLSIQAALPKRSLTTRGGSQGISPDDMASEAIRLMAAERERGER